MVGRNMSLKNPVTSPGIDPRTVRLVAQRLNHYAPAAPPPPHIQYFELNNVLLHLGQRSRVNLVETVGVIPDCKAIAYVGASNCTEDKGNKLTRSLRTRLPFTTVHDVRSQETAFLFINNNSETHYRYYEGVPK
jgi:hypothetical protein